MRKKNKEKGRSLRNRNFGRKRKFTHVHLSKSRGIKKREEIEKKRGIGQIGKYILYENI